MRSFAFRLSIATLPLAVSAQQVCMDVNTNLTMPASLVTRSPAWIVGKYVATQPLNDITGLDLRIGSNTPGMTVPIGIFAVDPVTGGPAGPIAMGSATLSQSPILYTGSLTAIAPPLNIPVGTEFFVGAEVGVKPSGTARIFYGGVAGQTGELYAGTPGAFALFRNGSIAFRIYCGTGTGLSFRYGQGQAGSNGVPVLVATGFPNIGNSIGLNISNSAPGLAGTLLFGTRSMLPAPPLGTLLVTPVFASLTGTTDMSGSLDYTFQLNGVGLLGAAFAWQGWIIDPGAAAGLAHTDAIETIIGN